MPLVVVADSSALARQVFAAVLEAAGHDVVPADDGVAAVRAVFAHQPDAVVLAASLPRLSGLAAARVLKADWRTVDVPVVLLSGLDAVRDITVAARSRVERHLTKDVEPAELTAAVAELLAAHPRAVRAGAAAVDAEEVLVRACAALDRALLEATVTTALGGLSGDDQESVGAQLLATLGGFVDIEAAALLLPARRVVVSLGSAERLVPHCLAALAQAGTPLAATDLARRELPPPREGDQLAAVLTMPLRGRDREVVAVLALGSGSATAYGESALNVLAAAEPVAAALLESLAPAR